MPKHEGKDIREVWDFRLSKGNPILYNDGLTWVVRIHANDGSGVFEEHDTEIPTMDKNGVRNPNDFKAVAACYDWLRTVRDNYSRDHIELRKPVVALINHANATINEMMANKDPMANQAIQDFNRAIKTATEDMHEKISAEESK